MKSISDKDYLLDLARCLDPDEACGSAKGLGKSDAKRLRKIAAYLPLVLDALQLVKNHVSLYGEVAEVARAIAAAENAR